MRGPVLGVAVAAVVSKAETAVSVKKAFEVVGSNLGAAGQCPV